MPIHATNYFMVLSPDKRIFAGALLLICLLILTKFILFKKSARYYKNYFRSEYGRYHLSQGRKAANVVPFKTIRMMQDERLPAEYRMDNLGGNIAGFVPLGFLLPLAFPVLQRWWRTACIILLFSLGFEIAQLLTGVGIFDIDDLILNVSGGILGYILFRIVALLQPKKRIEIQ